jgi:hypothetical protein
MKLILPDFLRVWNFVSHVERLYMVDHVQGLFSLVNHFIFYSRQHMQQMVQEAVRCDKLVWSGNNAENVVMWQNCYLFVMGKTFFH